MIRREKVKDIVEVRAFTHLNDFAADPGLTVGSYHFTDVTSDLMGKWLDGVSDVRPGRGNAMALAGLRGVGKSHFIAVLAALVSGADLRPKIHDPHILSRLERFPKRSMPVVFVKRGSGLSLMAELRTAVAETFSFDQQDLSDSLSDLLIKAATYANDSPIVLFIDTALGRESRVDRDDGALLSEIADAARNIGMFVGVALDDDVSGADGPNSSIARSYQIHFLDQEHLYRIVDRHIFPKIDAMLPVLKDIYSDYQSEIPGFKWSEQRFVPLYPMHPAILEISPLIRLFIQDFALLGFASEAGLKIMGRPADSLIGLDEMFSNVEPRLRKDPQLKPAFESFDKLDQEIVQKTPVHFRLKAKLILKGLFLLSLDGHGASAATIAASMMVFDDKDPLAGLEQVEGVLDRFAMDFPTAVSRVHEAGSTPQYCLKVGFNDDLEDAINALRTTVSDAEIWTTLLHQVSERFPEIQFENNSASTSHVTVEWRGGIRRGEIDWHIDRSEDRPASSELLDWKIAIMTSENSGRGIEASDACSLQWVIAQLTPEETETIGKYLLLRSNAILRQKFADRSVMASQLVGASVQKICQRIFFDDAKLHLDDRKFEMLYDSESSHSLAHVFTASLSPVFEYLYPAHPFFVDPLGPKETSQLTANFFGRADIFNPNTQNLARLFAAPLGLAEESPEGYVPATAESLRASQWVKAAFEDWDEAAYLSLSTLSSRFKSPPRGLTREAQQLVLTAMVAQRGIEFVTTTENRINYRSLDLQIIWDDVIGVSKPVGEKYSDAELLSWLRELTGEDSIDSLDDNQSNVLIDRSLQKWLSDWTSGKVLEEYEGLPDESLTAASWRTASSIRKSLGSVADIVHSHAVDSYPIRECIVSIADLFLGSQTEYTDKKLGLEVLRDFTLRAQRVQKISKYLAESEITDNNQVERARNLLLSVIQSSSLGTSMANDTLSSAWNRFHGLYKDLYLQHHRSLFTNDKSAVLRRLTESKQWQQFQIYSGLSAFDRQTKDRVQSLFREYRDISCQFNVDQCLDSLPYCFCGIKILDIVRISRIPDEVTAAVESGVSSVMQSVNEKSSRRPSITNQDNLILHSASLAGMAN